jgi:hypothetical protein
MDATEAKGMVKDATGKVQEAVGSGFGDAMTQIKGKANRLAGHQTGISRQHGGDGSRQNRRKPSGSARYRRCLKLLTRRSHRQRRR